MGFGFTIGQKTEKDEKGQTAGIIGLLQPPPNGCGENHNAIVPKTNLKCCHQLQCSRSKPDEGIKHSNGLTNKQIRYSNEWKKDRKRIFGKTY